MVGGVVFKVAIRMFKIAVGLTASRALCLLRTGGCAAAMGSRTVFRAASTFKPMVGSIIFKGRVVVRF